jgi:hypothetical protein
MSSAPGTNAPLSPLLIQYSRILHAFRDLQFVTMDGSSDRTVPVDFSASLMCRGRDGSTTPIELKKNSCCRQVSLNEAKRTEPTMETSSKT